MEKLIKIPIPIAELNKCKTLDDYRKLKQRLLNEHQRPIEINSMADAMVTRNKKNKPTTS